MTSFDLWAPVWLIGGVILAATGCISWWTFVFVTASHFYIKVKM
jgi:hypothetical protein